MRFQQSLDFGLSLLSSYTWSKSIDDASGFFTSAGDPNFPQDSLNVRAERGRSNFDIRHRLSISYSYDLQIGRGRALLADSGWVSALLSGWQTFGVVSLQTGRPFTVALLSEIDQSNTGRSTLGFGANDRPNVVGDPYGDTNSVTSYLNPANVVIPTDPNNPFGNAARNSVRGPAIYQFDLAAMKTFVLPWRDARVQFRAEIFNLFNRTNFRAPGANRSAATFGIISSTYDPRQVQFGLKVMF